jgi:hypothetical protein
MPRPMPRFDQVLLAQVNAALGIVAAGESLRVATDSHIRAAWHLHRIETLYEIAYLRIFAAWEACLESIFVRSLCGFASTAGRETLVSGSYHSSLQAAELAMLGGRNYLLWSNPSDVVGRCRRFFSACPTTGRTPLQEMVIGAYRPSLEEWATVRHRIAHDQSDGKRKFDATTRRVASRVYRGARPGRFLRDWDSTSPARQRWISTIANELVVLSGQMI